MAQLENESPPEHPLLALVGLAEGDAVPMDLSDGKDEELLWADEDTHLEKYEDAALDFVDATIVSMAERLNISTVLTLDKRDFHMIRPRHTGYFTIMP